MKIMIKYKSIIYCLDMWFSRGDFRNGTMRMSLDIRGYTRITEDIARSS
jgi:hypothetical protein